MRDAFFDQWSETVAPFEHNLMQDAAEDFRDIPVDTSASIQDTTVAIIEMFEGVMPVCHEQYPNILDMESYYGDLNIMDSHSSTSTSESSSPCPQTPPSDTTLADSETSDQDSPVKAKPVKSMAVKVSSIRDGNPLFHFTPHHEDEYLRLESHSEPVLKPKPTKPTVKKVAKVRTAGIASSSSIMGFAPVVTAVPCLSTSPKSKIAKKKKSTQTVSRKMATAIATQQAPICAPEYMNTTVMSETSPDVDAQCSCCIHGCTNTVTNRLRFSLRRISSFKNDFIGRSWNKICSYHYFNDLYQHKKANSAQ